MIEILETDTEFTNSPDAGHSTCLCSRCKNKIKIREVPIRIGVGEGPAMTEYRYCDACQRVAGINFVSMPDFDFDEDEGELWDDDEDDF